MSWPLTSTGPRMYLTAGVLSVAGSQATSGLAGSERSRFSVEGLTQSSASNSLTTSPVTQLLSLALAGSAVGLGSLSSGVRCSAGTAAGSPAAITGRKFMSADAWMRSRVSFEGVPGRLTTTLRPDCVLISASATPEPSTRWRMIATAWFSCSSLMSLAPSTRGARIIWVPPSRSNASLGAQLAWPVITPPARTAVSTTKIAPSQVSTLRAEFLGPVRAIIDLPVIAGQPPAEAGKRLPAALRCRRSFLAR
ncbi:hypothetical protein PJL18_01661 [Paenarthrobacter nicotinovorans]|nr:hypothetical protein [Paenarthrobacter nicotinovorans]